MEELISEERSKRLLREFANVEPGDPKAREKILAIYQEAGGIDVFKRSELPHYLSFFRECVVGAWEFPPKDYLELFHRLEKVKREHIYMLSSNPLLLTNGEVFTKLWRLNRDQTFRGLMRVVGRLMAYSRHHYEKSLEQLPVIHTAECLKGNNPGHYGCVAHIITHGDEARKYFQGVQQGLTRSVSTELLELLSKEALELSMTSKEDYAQSVLVRPEHWRQLLADKRTVISALAKNPLLPEEIAYEIMDAHKSPGLREDIAKNAASYELLEYIWKSTKSKTIRRAVAANGLSGRHIRNPEALSIW